eukprot:747447-Hanusia_phi.AAC.1
MGYPTSCRCAEFAPWPSNRVFSFRAFHERLGTDHHGLNPGQGGTPEVRLPRGRGTKTRTLPHPASLSESDQKGRACCGAFTSFDVTVITSAVPLLKTGFEFFLRSLLRQFVSYLAPLLLSSKSGA